MANDPSVRVRQRLAARLLPNDGGTWLALVQRHAIAAGAVIQEVCTPGRRTTSVARARRNIWRELRAAGYSLCEIAEPWGAHHTSVMKALRRRAA